MEKKILPPLLQGFEPVTFQSRVRRSSHWAIPVPCILKTYIISLLPHLHSPVPNKPYGLCGYKALWKKECYLVFAHIVKFIKRNEKIMGLSFIICFPSLDESRANNKPINQSVSYSISQSVNNQLMQSIMYRQASNKSTNQSTDQSKNQSINPFQLFLPFTILSFSTWFIFLFQLVPSVALVMMSCSSSLSEYHWSILHSFIRSLTHPFLSAHPLSRTDGSFTVLVSQSINQSVYFIYIFCDNCLITAADSRSDTTQ